MGGAAAYNPKDAVGGIDEEELALLVGKAVFVVGEEVAEELCAMLHAEGLETVGLTPVAQGEGEREAVGIEEGLVGREVAIVDGGGGGIELLDGEGREGLGVGLREGEDEEGVAVEHCLMGGGEESAARSGAAQDVGHHSTIEAIGPEELEEELLPEQRRLGHGGGQGMGGAKVDADGTVGPGDGKGGAEGLEEGVVELFDGLEMGDGGGKGFVGRGLQLAQEREELVAHLVAAVEEGGVGGVLDMVEAMGGGVGFDLVAAEGEQGSHHAALDGEDAVEAGKAGAAEEVEEEGFGRVVAVVGGEDDGIVVGGAEGVEPGVAELAGRLFDALAMAAGMGEGVELGYMDGDMIAARKTADEGFVAVAVDRAQMEVAVGYGKGEAGRVHEVGQDHRVDAPTNGQQHLLPGGEEVLLTNVGYEVLEHLLDSHLEHAALAVEVDAIVVDTSGEHVLVDGDGAAALRIGSGALVDGAPEDVGDEEARLASIGQ